MDVAIAHDQFKTLGGAERVACELARTFDAPIYAGWVDQSIVPEDVDVRQVFDSRSANLVHGVHHMAEDLYQMQAWQQCEELVEYDTVLINKTNPGWFVPRDDQTVVWYLHSTPRGLYDRFQDWDRGAVKRYISAIMRAIYSPNIRYADAWVCNSELVERRLNRYWDIDNASVVHPPVPTEDYSTDAASTGEYYLTLGRLRRHKRTREIVEAATDLGLPLKVAGDGNERETLEEIAGPTVEILGYVSESEKQRLLSEAKAFVFNAINEDFGMTPIEAMGAGTPVIGVRDGYTKFQIRDGKNGILFDRGTVPNALKQFERFGVDWSEDQISEWATERFGCRQFRDLMREIVSTAQTNADISPTWDEEPQSSEDVELRLTDGGEAEDA